MLRKNYSKRADKAAYDLFKITIMDGDQLGSDFVAITNSKIPALLNRPGDDPIHVFESANILLYLAEKFGKFLPQDTAKHYRDVNWLFCKQNSTIS